MDLSTIMAQLSDRILQDVTNFFVASQDFNCSTR